MLDVKPLHPVAALASPAADKKTRRPTTGSLNNPDDSNDDQGRDHFVYLRSTWVFSSLRHPLWRLATCWVRLACCFVVCVTSPLLASHHTPAFFPVYGDLVGVLFTHGTIAKVFFHGTVVAVVLALVRLVMYPLWFEDRWNWRRQYKVARLTFRGLSRASSASQLVRNAAGNDRDEGATTIMLHVHESRTDEAPTTRIRVHTTPRAQGSWTLMVLLTPMLWWAIVSALRGIVKGTDYDELLFGKSKQASETPQWRVQLIVYNVLMTLNLLSLLVTADSILQDTRHCLGVWQSLRRAYSSSGILRILACWMALSTLIVGGVYFECFTMVVSITAGYRLFPATKPTTIESELDVIKLLSKEGSIGRYFLQSRLDRVPALICVAMMVGLFVWMQNREHWRLCYAAFLGQPTRSDQEVLMSTLNASAPKSTREALKEQLRLYSLYRVRSQFDLFGSCLALVSVGSVIFQVRSIWRATTGAPDIQDAAGETYGVLLLVVSMSMVYQLYHRYALKYEMLVLRNQIPPTTSRWWWYGTPRQLLLYPFLAEVVLSGLCLPPFLHGDLRFDEERYFVMTSKAQASPITCPTRMVVGSIEDDGYASCELQYSYPVEVLNLVVLVRLYWFVRLLRNELFRRMFSDHAALLVSAGIGGNVPSEISSLRWSFRMCLSLIPGRVIFGIFLMLWTGTAAAVSILERPFPSLLDSEEHSLWLTIVTISAVGYGDAYPLTAFGRLSIILGAVVGGAIVVSLMTSIFLDTLKGSRDEHKFVQELERITWDKKLQHLSATLIAAAWKARRERLRGQPGNDAVFQLAHDFKAARKQCRPKETFESLEQLRITSIAKWRTKQLIDWTQETSAERNEIIETMERHIAALETVMRPLLM